MSTKFQLFDTSNAGDGEADDDTLREPIFASFPNRTPGKDELKEMKFTIKQ